MFKKNNISNEKFSTYSVACIASSKIGCGKKERVRVLCIAFDSVYIVKYLESFFTKNTANVSYRMNFLCNGTTGKKLTKEYFLQDIRILGKDSLIRATHAYEFQLKILV